MPAADLYGTYSFHAKGPALQLAQQAQVLFLIKKIINTAAIQENEPGGMLGSTKLTAADL